MRRDESGTLAATTVVTKTIKLCAGAGRRTITFNYRRREPHTWSRDHSAINCMPSLGSMQSIARIS
jgi:hypothetical protein